MIRISLPWKGPGHLPTQRDIVCNIVAWNRYRYHSMIQLCGGMLSRPNAHEQREGFLIARQAGLI